METSDSWLGRVSGALLEVVQDYAPVDGLPAMGVAVETD